MSPTPFLSKRDVLDLSRRFQCPHRVEFRHHFPSVARAEVAADLARLTPGDLTYSVFASGGSEAIDVAIKSARRPPAAGRS